MEQQVTNLYDGGIIREKVPLPIILKKVRGQDEKRKKRMNRKVDCLDFFGMRADKIRLVCAAASFTFLSFAAPRIDWSSTELNC